MSMPSNIFKYTHVKARTVSKHTHTLQTHTQTHAHARMHARTRVHTTTEQENWQPQPFYKLCSRPPPR